MQKPLHPHPHPQNHKQKPKSSLNLHSTLGTTHYLYKSIHLTYDRVYMYIDVNNPSPPTVDMTPSKSCHKLLKNTHLHLRDMRPNVKDGSKCITISTTNPYGLVSSKNRFKYCDHNTTNHTNNSSKLYIVYSM